MTSFELMGKNVNGVDHLLDKYGNFQETLQAQSHLQHAPKSTKSLEENYMWNINSNQGLMDKL